MIINQHVGLLPDFFFLFCPGVCRRGVCAREHNFDGTAEPLL